MLGLSTHRCDANPLFVTGLLWLSSVSGLIQAAPFEATGNTDPTHQASSYYQGEVSVTFDTMTAYTRFDLPTFALMVPGVSTVDAKEIWYFNGAAEGYDTLAENASAAVEGESYEAINDSNNLYNRYWIESENEARIVVRHRSALYHGSKGILHVTNTVPATPWGALGEWVDEWYTFHPDGTHTRKVRIYTLNGTNTQTVVRFDGPKGHVHEIEAMYMYNNSYLSGRGGRVASSDVEDEVLTLIKANGNYTNANYATDPYEMKFYGGFKKSVIHVINTKTTSGYKPFRICRDDPNPTIEPYEVTPTGSDLLVTLPNSANYFYGGVGYINFSSHWQVETNCITEIFLNGFTTSTPSNSAVELPRLSRSWQYAPALTLTNESAASVYGYDMGERAFLIEADGAAPYSLHLRAAASNEAPIVNPMFLINNWGDDEPMLGLNGTNIAEGTAFRYGYYSSLDLDDDRSWTNVLAVWVEVIAEEPITFSIDHAPFIAWLGANYPSAPDLKALTAADTDGDGANSGAEYLAGTSPTNAASVFEIIRAETSGGDGSLTWLSTPGRTYSVYASTNLVEGWSRRVTNNMAADVSGTNVLVDASLEPSVFYRITTP